MNELAIKDPIAPETEKDTRWALVLARDPSADGKFYYSVSTTGVYCRPSCGARLARPEHVRFHDSPAAAEQAGFRACKRCKPDQPSMAEQHAARIAAVCRLIEESEESPALNELAQHAGLSQYHFHRIFKSLTGVTPNKYAAAHRANRLRKKLGRSSTITEAIYDAGYNSNGYVHGIVSATGGMATINLNNFVGGGKPVPSSVFN